MSAVAIIPARGGSKRLPRKNIRPLLGLPVIVHVIRAARDSGCFAEVMVSTEDPEIAAIAREHGAAVPFVRSTATAGDEAGTVAVLREVLDRYGLAGRQFELGCCLYPTAALVRPAALRAARERLKASPGATSVVPVVAYTHPIQRALRLRDGRLEAWHPEHTQTRTQDLEPAYHDAGQWYWFRSRALADPAFTLLGPGALAEVLDPLAAQDIDTEADWALLEAKYRLLNGPAAAP